MNRLSPPAVSLTASGLVAKRGAHSLDCRRSLAGRDRGWDCARILPHLDFDAIRRNPKVPDRTSTLPIGAAVEIDATAGSIRMLTSAVR